MSITDTYGFLTAAPMSPTPRQTFVSSVVTFLLHSHGRPEAVPTDYFLEVANRLADGVFGPEAK